MQHTNRDAHGRFVSGNTIAVLGGQARMAQLTPAEKRALAKRGFAALQKRFKSKRACAAWLFDPLNYRGQHEG
jgi:hypothetical protein